MERTAEPGGDAKARGEVPGDVRHLLNDTSYEFYDPDRDPGRLDEALAAASGAAPHSRVTITLSGLEGACTLGSAESQAFR